MGVIAGDVLGRLLKHAGLVNFYTYIFMKNYTLNFTAATVQGTKKIPPKRTQAGFFLSRQRYRSNAADVSGDRDHRIR
ncbi:hypothetical protein [Pseudomonas svalbardensis]|uniref:hypothetical protein n=1 Tax=Pseudomonas svalbardensis TaxID=3042029 RepID=UPI00350E5174